MPKVNYGGYDIDETWKLESNPTYTGGDGDIFYNSADPTQAVKVQRNSQIFSDIYQNISQQGKNQVSGETAYTGDKSMLSLEAQAEQKRLADLSSQIISGQITEEAGTASANTAQLNDPNFKPQYVAPIQEKSSSKKSTGSSSSVAKKKAQDEADILASNQANGYVDGTRNSNTSTGATNQEQTSAPTSYFSGANLSTGSKGPAVQQLQTSLGIQADGLFGPQTQAAVKQFQLSHGLKADGIVGPQTMAALNRQQGDTGETVLQGAGDSQVKKNEAASGTSGIPSTGNATIDSLLSQLQKASPQTTFSEVYKQVYKDLGIDTIKKAYADSTKEYEKLQDKKNDEIQDINNNPWYSEGVRVQKLGQLDKKYEGKELILQNTLKLQETQMDNARQDAQFAVGGIMDQINYTSKLNQDIILKAIDIAESQLSAESGLQDTTDLKEYNFAKSQGYTGTFTDYQKEQANLKASIAKAGVAQNIAPNVIDPNNPQTVKDLSTINQINNILDMPAFDSAFGITGNVNRAISGSQAKAVEGEVNQVIGILALAGRSALKGQGAVSDFEGQLLKNAQTSLNFGLSPDAARQALKDVRGALITSFGGSANVKITAPDGTSKLGTATQAMITDAILQGYKVSYQ